MLFRSTEKIGDGWATDLERMRQLEGYVDDPEFRSRWQAIKDANKRQLAERILKTNDEDIDPTSLYDVQVKRIHEYKRQLLNILHVIGLYNRIKANPQTNILPRTFIFAGKAAPGYYMAKLVIRLINAVGKVVNRDRQVAGRIKVVFVPGYSVSLGQIGRAHV